MKLKNLSPEAVKESSLAGEPIIAKLSHAPGNNAPIDGLKVIARSGWFAARPSGTEAVYKIYAESFKDEAHLDAIVGAARAMVDAAVSGSGAPASRERTSDMMERSPAIVLDAVSTGLPRLGYIAAHHLAALLLRYRRSWAQRSGLDRPAGRCRPKLVAIAAIWSGGIRQLAV